MMGALSQSALYSVQQRNDMARFRLTAGYNRQQKSMVFGDNRFLTRTSRLTRPRCLFRAFNGTQDILGHNGLLGKLDEQMGEIWMTGQKLGQDHHTAIHLSVGMSYP